MWGYRALFFCSWCRCCACISVQETCCRCKKPCVYKLCYIKKNPMWLSLFIHSQGYFGNFEGLWEILKSLSKKYSTGMWPLWRTWKETNEKLCKCYILRDINTSLKVLTDFHTCLKTFLWISSQTVICQTRSVEPSNNHLSLVLFCRVL